MSSTTFYLFSAPLDGHRLRLCVIPTPAGSVESCAYTRSFVLMALAEAHSTMEQRSAMFPFVAEPEWYRDPWMRKHVKDYVESTESAHDLNCVPVKGPDKAFARAWKAIGKAQEKLPAGADHALPIRNALHTIRHYWIDVVLTDPRWASHLEMEAVELCVVRLVVNGPEVEADVAQGWTFRSKQRAVCIGVPRVRLSSRARGPTGAAAPARPRGASRRGEACRRAHARRHAQGTHSRASREDGGQGLGPQAAHPLQRIADCRHCRGHQRRVEGRLEDGDEAHGRCKSAKANEKGLLGGVCRARSAQGRGVGFRAFGFVTSGPPSRAHRSQGAAGIGVGIPHDFPHQRSRARAVGVLTYAEPRATAHRQQNP